MFQFQYGAIRGWIGMNRDMALDSSFNSNMVRLGVVRRPQK